MQKQKKFFTRKKIIIFVILILVVSLLFFCGKKGNTNPESTMLWVMKEISYNQIPISGYIQAARTQTLEAPGEGLVENVPVKEGDTVKEGQIIFKLDDSEERYNLANQEYLMRQEEINASPRKLQLMKEQYDMLKKRVDDKTVRAKFNGIIASLTATEGEYALTKTNFGAIVDRSYLKATVEVTETDASKLKVNQKVMLTFSSLETPVEGYVVSYPSIARVTDIGRTVVDTLIQIDNPPESVLPGYSFDGYIEVGEMQEIIIVSEEAIKYIDDATYVDVITNDNKIETRLVQIQDYTPGFVQVLSGLQESEMVVNQLFAK